MSGITKRPRGERQRPIWRKRPQGGEGSESPGSSFLTCRLCQHFSAAATTHLLPHLLMCNHTIVTTVIAPGEACRWPPAQPTILSFLKKLTPPSFTCFNSAPPLHLQFP